MKTPIYSETALKTLPLSKMQDGAFGEHGPDSGEIISLGVVRPGPRTTQKIQRFFDFLISGTFLLVFFGLLYVPIAIAIRLNSRGPILFVQKRVGKDGEEFPFYKFRSMVNDAEELRRELEAQNERNGPVFKMRDDPRITRVGRFLRKFSLDELPQFINVFRGEMSLVGPRPALPREVAQYTPRQQQRLAVTPGITGLWQVSGRASVNFEHSVELDLYYIQNQSLSLNFWIMLKTIPAVLSGDGAY